MEGLPTWMARVNKPARQWLSASLVLLEFSLFTSGLDPMLGGLRPPTPDLTQSGVTDGP